MAIDVQTVQELQDYFLGVSKRSEHHAPNVSNVIYPLLGLIILNADLSKKVEVRSYSGGAGNMIWIHIGNNRYAFKYDHDADTIEIREQTYKGKLLHVIDDNTSIDRLKEIFELL